MIRSLGGMGLDEANDANIPVCVFINKPESGGTAWTLSANNYMPRKNMIAEGMYQYVADSRDELMQLVQKWIVPLYECAVNNLKIRGELYYWNIGE